MNDIDHICAVYSRRGSIRGTAAELGISAGTIRKALITAGLIRSALWEEKIRPLMLQGKTPAEIASELGIAETTVNVHSPYTKGLYRSSEPTENALRIRACRERKTK